MNLLHCARRRGLRPALPIGGASVHLDALRGFAAFSVLLNHWRDTNLIDYPKLGHHSPWLAAWYFMTGLGHQWVIVFFVMSGYLVGGSVLNAFARGVWSWRAYLLTRLTRLLVVLIPALLLGGAWDWIGMHEHSADALYQGKAGLHELAVDVRATLKPTVMLGNMAFLQTISLPGMNGKRVPAFGSNGALWSLSNEFWYYMAFPVLVMFFSATRSFIFRIACASILAAWGWFVGASIVWLAIPWLTGVVVTFLPSAYNHSAWIRRAIVGTALSLVVVGLAIAKLWTGRVADILLGGLVAYLLWVLINFTSGSLPFLYKSIAQRAARSSYTLYLVHVPILIFLTASFKIQRITPSVSGLVPGLLVLAAIIIYAQLVYAAFERNTDAIRKLLRPYILRQ
jgi:peptidoglycan/LPS O-acetylase OafA/YrhL